MYCSYERDTNFLTDPLILTPRICVASPISLVSNLDDNYPFISKMYSLLFPAVTPQKYHRIFFYNFIIYLGIN